MSLNSKLYRSNVCLCLVCAVGVCVFGGTVFGQPWDGNGVEGDPYQIWDANQMNAIGGNPGYWNKHFKLMADIDLSDFNGLNGNPSFNIIGVTETPFPGTFDGNNHTISNFTHSSPGTHCVAIFGYVSGANAEIKNLGLIDPNVNAGTGSNVGSLVGYCHEGTITGCYVDSGSVSGSGYTTGGLVGQTRAGLVTNCHTTGIAVKGGYVAGGLVAWNSNATISSCYSTASVLGDEEVGGLVGQNDAGTITNCYSTGSAAATGWFVGGLVGMNYYALITNSYSTSKVTGNSRVGGLVGSNNGGTIVSSFWDKQTSGRTNMCGWECCGGASCNNAFGKTTAEMKTESTFTSAGWDFSTPVWQMCDELCYPKLAWEQGASIGVPMTALDFGALLDGPNPPGQPLSIGNCVSGVLEWTISEDCNWLFVDPNSGTSAAYDSNDVTLTVDINGLDYGFYSCDLTVTDPNAANSPQTVPVTLHVCIHALGEIFVPDEYATIQQAIDAAGPNNIVMVDPGTHYENIDFNGKNVKVSSTYPDEWDVIASTIIDGNNQGTVITFESAEDPNCHLTGFTITDGNDKGEGGGIRINRDTSPTISNCIVAANKGRGIYSYRSQPKISNCLIAGNTGAGIQTTGRDSATITNCTIVENGAEGIYSSYGRPTVTNCIIWANADPCIADRPTVTFSDVEGGSAGLGNIDKDPCFVEPGYWADANDPNIIVEPNDPNAIWIEGDYHLLQTSPCIDTGDPNFIPEPNETDLAGNPRVADGDGDGNSVVDMGAYEFAIAEPVEPLEMLAELGEMVEELGLSEGVENSLLAKLEAAGGVLEDDNGKNDGAAVNILGAFINAASAQSGKKISEADADALIAEAVAIIEALESG